MTWSPLFFLNDYYWRGFSFSFSLVKRFIVFILFRIQYERSFVSSSCAMSISYMRFNLNCMKQSPGQMYGTERALLIGRSIPWLYLSIQLLLAFVFVSFAWALEFLCFIRSIHHSLLSEEKKTQAHRLRKSEKKVHHEEIWSWVLFQINLVNS